MSYQREVLEYGWISSTHLANLTCRRHHGPWGTRYISLHRGSLKNNIHHHLDSSQKSQVLTNCDGIRSMLDFSLSLAPMIIHRNIHHTLPRWEDSVRNQTFLKTHMARRVTAEAPQIWQLYSQKLFETSSHKKEPQSTSPHLVLPNLYTKKAGEMEEILTTPQNP